MLKGQGQDSSLQKARPLLPGEGRTLCLSEDEFSWDFLSWSNSKQAAGPQVVRGHSCQLDNKLWFSGGGVLQTPGRGKPPAPQLRQAVCG